ncbi:MAG: AraC family transcriptional regulator [Rhodocyclaceae bacterium]|jgi:AraC-like DNA-binding protein|nr:AraC family transcriptional regulator [Rhodocyclaceae bacterium]MBK6553346.1 AraC family transcriptional regulator [Rhodocyclaceae bacterium]MBK6678466.1 AraC family transcriptional regulator [Rhodocyclaceae bacterium]MBK9311493.1 AraC family transcriptional regulator [Rhodocyclaceae bacterium]MBK9956332.1 AraC family transcriptional regulator [Rhodocyclaceae bacterium]
MKQASKLAFYLERMASRSIPTRQVLRGSGLSVEQLNDEGLRVQPEQYRRVILNMMELTKDPFIGIALGSEFKISNLGILGYAALSAANLEQSRELFNKYRALNENIFASTNYIRDGRWFSEIRDTFMLGEVIRFAVEEFVSRTIELASTLTNRPFPILELHVTYPRPADIRPYVRRFDCVLHFNQPRNIVVFDINRLRDPISLANEEVFKLCDQQCQLLVSRHTNLLCDRIRNHVLNNPGEFPTLDEMAKRLNLGSRTLRRRLVKENVTYQQILDDIRKTLAIQYLQGTSLTPKEIGYTLGYSSVSNFRRAFRSWTGKKLSDFREIGDAE